ncbi:MAG: hypothetical protein WCP21_00625 [Armatimonadota bacterium]
MVKKLSLGISAVMFVCALSGCAGLLILASSYLAISNVVGTIDNWTSGLFDHDVSKYSLYLDGYDTGVHPEASGTLSLAGLPAGSHVLSLEYDGQRVGFHKNVTLVADQQFELGQVSLTANGSLISGKVERAPGVPLAGIRVAAVLGGATLLTTGHGAVQLPTGTDTTQTVILGFTDASGRFTLGPAVPGQWLVTSAAAGSHADAVIVSVANGKDATNLSLSLPADTGGKQGVITGTVTKESGGNVIASALVASQFDAPFTPALTDARVDAFGGQVGLTLRAQPWFQWHSLATQTNTSGEYTLKSPAGAQNVNAFRFGFRAKGADVDLADGQATAASFALPSL